jgi:transcription initiation factor TFIIIB Brf1 subunit/transcription initiation factor TFIIB
MSDFSVFEDALNELIESEKIDITKKGDEKKLKIKKCIHENLNEENGILSCLDCGSELMKSIFHDKEWRYYGQSDNKKMNDPNRVTLRKRDEKTIYKDVENMGFSDKIINFANELYLQVTNKQIYRGNFRKSIIFACVFHTFKVYNIAQAHEDLISLFDIDKKNGLKGLKYVMFHIQKDSIIHQSYITPSHLVEHIMDKFSATPEQKKEVISMYEKVQNKSSKLNRARPQSVAGMIFNILTIYKQYIYNNTI